MDYANARVYKRVVTNQTTNQTYGSFKYVNLTVQTSETLTGKVIVPTYVNSDGYSAFPMISLVSGQNVDIYVMRPTEATLNGNLYVVVYDA